MPRIGVVLVMLFLAGCSAPPKRCDIEAKVTTWVPLLCGHLKVSWER